jgi:hypothetical protein
MPRQPKIRVHYRADAAYLLRLIYAVERDVRRPAEWRQQLVEKLQAVALELQAAPKIDGESDDDGNPTP